MSKQIQSVEEVLAEQGYYVSTTVGSSMWPLLRSRRDSVEIRPVQGRLNRLDVPLYRQAGKLVLHRVVRVTADGYVICGDNCDFYERDVTDAQIVGVMTSFYRGEKHHNVNEKGYRLYSRVWVALFPIRWLVKRVLRILSKIKHRLFG